MCQFSVNQTHLPSCGAKDGHDGFSLGRKSVRIQNQSHIHLTGVTRDVCETRYKRRYKRLVKYDLGDLVLLLLAERTGTRWDRVVKNHDVKLDIELLPFDIRLDPRRNQQNSRFVLENHYFPLFELVKNFRSIG